MAKWTYGKEGEAFPVREGEVWRCGRHYFVCSDAMASRRIDQVLNMLPSPLQPSLLYCDPPWGQALLNGFRTKAGLQKANYTWQELYRRLADLGQSRNMPVYMEGSVIEHRDGSKIPAAIAHKAIGSDRFSYYWEVKYYRTHPSGLFYAGNRPAPPSLTMVPSPLTHTDDDYTPGIVMQAYGQFSPTMRKVVFDPCAGRGQTSRQAETVGWTSVNNELNSNRVSAALVRMAKMIDQEPERVEL